MKCRFSGHFSYNSASTSADELTTFTVFSSTVRVSTNKVAKYSIRRENKKLRPGPVPPSNAPTRKPPTSSRSNRSKEKQRDQTPNKNLNPQPIKSESEQEEIGEDPDLPPPARRRRGRRNPCHRRQCRDRPSPFSPSLDLPPSAPQPLLLLLLLLLLVLLLLLLRKTLKRVESRSAVISRCCLLCPLASSTSPPPPRLHHPLHYYLPSLKPIPYTSQSPACFTCSSSLPAEGADATWLFQIQLTPPHRRPQSERPFSDRTADGRTIGTGKL